MDILGPSCWIRGPMALGSAEPFSFEDLKRRAKTLAQTAYTPPPQPSDSDPLRDMTFDTFAQAVYKPEMELWHGVPGAQTGAPVSPGSLLRRAGGDLCA